MKTIVVYNSKTGFTKRYAEWIAEDLGCEAFPYKGFKASAVSDGNIVIYCGRVAAGKIEHLESFRKLMKGLDLKALVVAAVGATPGKAKETVNTIWSNNFSKDELKATPHYYLEGGLDYDKMSFGDRTILKMVSKMLEKNKDKAGGDAIEQGFSGSFDNTSKEAIKPLVNFVRHNSGKE